MSYTHLSLEERHYIEIEHKKGVSMNKISKSLSRNQSSISREINRNTGQKGYRHKQADCLSRQRLHEKPKANKLTAAVKSLIISYLKQDWSPEQIAGRLKHDGVITLHHETIYQYVLADKTNGGSLYLHLRHQHKKYRKRYGCARNRTGIPDRVDIDKRPAVANNRTRIGDWEADTIIGKNNKGAIVTLDERRSKLRLAAPLRGKHTIPLTDAVISMLKPIKKFILTMTFDNGKEFARHNKIAKALACDTYFAKPYHSWERGQNENANGLLRQYFPKTMELIDISTKQVMTAIAKLNSRPRKCLGFKTPYEAFQQLTGVDVEKLMGYALMT